MKIKNTFIRYIKLILRPLIYVIYFLSGFFPRDNKIWVFGSTGGRRFADNAKWFFYYCNWKKMNEKDHPYQYIWITRSKDIIDSLKQQGFKAYYLYSPKGIYYSLRAGIYIFDLDIWDINFPFSRKAIKINLWHGSPLKKIARDVAKVDDKNIFQKMRIYNRNPIAFHKYDMMISSSKYVRKIFLSAFNVKNNNVVITGYPRNDVLLGAEYTNYYLNQEEEYHKIKKLKEDSRNKLVIYLPTFRDSNLEKNKNVIKDFLEYQDILDKNGIILLIKPHELERISITIKDKKNIWIIDPRSDIYPLLRISDVLITDYSSVFFDYLLLNKPIVFFPYDLDEYKRSDRELYSDYYQEITGPAETNLDNLIKTIVRLVNDDVFEKEILDKKYIKIKTKYNILTKNSYSENVYHCIKNIFL